MSRYRVVELRAKKGLEFTEKAIRSGLMANSVHHHVPQTMSSFDEVTSRMGIGRFTSERRSNRVVGESGRHEGLADITHACDPHADSSLCTWWAYQGPTRFRMPSYRWSHFLGTEQAQIEPLSSSTSMFK